MEHRLKALIENLTKQVGLHRELLELIRKEHQALLDADLRSTQETTLAKETVLTTLGQVESARLGIMQSLEVELKTKLDTLSKVIIAVQGTWTKQAESLTSQRNALTILTTRIRDLNQQNRRLVETSLEHVLKMKSNVLGEAAHKSQTYSSSGSKQTPATGARLISAEV